MHWNHPRNRHNVRWMLLILIGAFFAGAGAAEKNPLMRFPDIHDDTIVFVHGEDIWSVPAEGGVAVRLTIHDGEERYPKFSPDGRLIAFTGEYDGNDDVYVMNRHGGDITRVTFHPSADRVIGWHPIKNKIMFVSRRRHIRFSKIYLINPDGTDLEEVILHNAAHGSFSPDGNRIVYNKVAREFRTWKRYQGGNAQDVLLYDLETDTEVNLTDFVGTDRMPMWIGDKVYFSSDRDGVLNIYAVDPVTAEIRQITRHMEYDIRRPSEGGSNIVYELGGTLWNLDTQTGATHKVPVEIRTDLPEARPRRIDVAGYITGIDCAPDGDKALIVARGEVFTVADEEGVTRNLTNDSGSRDKDAAWSPDGSRIAYLSDKSGEYEIYLVDAKGSAEPERLTRHKSGYRHTLRWSPDGEKIAYTDHDLTLYILDVDKKKTTKVDKAHYENIDVALDLKPIYDFSWSPDSRYIAYSKMDEDLVNKVYIYDLETRKIAGISTLFNDFHPVFSSDGEHLFFISNRRFNPTLCDFEWQMVYKKMAGIYAVTLRSDGPSIRPFPSCQDESENKDETDTDVVIDFEGITDRIEPLPLPRGNYRYLAANASHLFFLNKDEGDFNRFEFRNYGRMDLHAYAFEDQEDRTIFEGIDAYELSADGSRIVYLRDEEVGFLSAKSPKPGMSAEKLDLSHLKMWLNPVAEWTQIFSEAWRVEREFYYEPNMHGVDWEAMKDKYGRLVPHASCRQDMRYIIGELIGELNTSHTYVGGGDRNRRSEAINIGMLGVDWEADAKNERYRFGRILGVPDWARDIMPPLSKPGMRIEEGHYLIQVNGTEVTTERNIYSYFQGLAGTLVTLLVNDTPDHEDAWEITVRPARSDRRLRYLDWVETNRQIVDRESGGKLGYLHFPDTYVGSAIEFPKHFYSQSRKEGLVVDARFNGGGLSPDIFLSRLNAKPESYWTRRYSHDFTSPVFAVTGHMACLTNRQAGSGGDEFPHMFQQLGMGPVIGTRTWGGLVGMSMSVPLIDGGRVTAPDYRIYEPDGSWVVENEGVTPDVIVDLHPKEMADGFDAQLMKAVEILLEKIEDDPFEWPQHEAFPVDPQVKE